jgi:hypothetical protein
MIHRQRHQGDKYGTLCIEPAGLVDAGCRSAGEAAVYLVQPLRHGAVAEKVGALSQQLNDPAFPQVTYRRSGRAQLVAVLRGNPLRVTLLVVVANTWAWTRPRSLTRIALPRLRCRRLLPSLPLMSLRLQH